MGRLQRTPQRACSPGAPPRRDEGGRDGRSERRSELVREGPDSLRGMPDDPGRQPSPTCRPTPGPACTAGRCGRGSGCGSPTRRVAGTTSSSSPGKRFFSNRGHLDHDDLIGREEGFTVTSSAGGEYLVFRPLLSEFVVSMPRGAAVVYPKDAAQIVAMADIFPGADVVEAGVGFRGPDLLAAARGRTARHRVVVRAARGVRRRGPTQRHPVLRREDGQSHPAWRLTLGDLAEELPRRATAPTG